MEPKRKKPDNMFRIGWVDPNDTWIDKLDSTHYLMIALDLLEVDVEDSKNVVAKRMLRRIGIKC